MIAALLVLTLLVEALMYTRLTWRYRKALVIVLTLLVPAATTSLLFQHPNWITAVIAFLSIGRLLNFLRIAEARMHEEYLRRSTQRTSRIFGGGQILLLPVVIGLLPFSFNLGGLPRFVAIAQAVVATAILIITARNIYKTRYRQGTTFYADRDLPTVTLAVPARNETNDLQECLRSAVANDYPKLEIIVLDDCSQAKTSEIIKSFAHDGVRFIRGDEPGQRWLAKNQAYQKLSEEASGELVLFCGADVRFGTNAIRALVTELLNRDKQMISILPHRLTSNIAEAFIQPMRYWWELSLPRKLFNRPPVLSTCWLIRRKALHKLGGFGAVSHTIIPEGFFARELVKTNDYSFIRANETLDIQTRKSFADQRDTAIRVRYPQLRRRPEVVLALLIADLTLLLGPFAGLIYGLLQHDGPTVLFSAIAAALLVANNILIVQVTNPPNTIIALFNFPLAVLTEVVISIMSMVRYEFGSVDWKDRNVCIPVMHVTPHLPKLN